MFTQQFLHFLKNIRQALGFVWVSGRHWTLAGVALLIVQGILPLATLYLVKLLVDAVAEGLQTSDMDAALNEVGVLLLLSGLLALVTSVCGILSNFITRAHTRALVDHMNSVLLCKSAEIDLEYYENSDYYDALHRAQAEAPWRPREILTSLLNIGQSSVTLVALAGLMFWLHWSIFIILLLTALPEVLARLHHSKKLFVWQRKRTPLERKSGYFNWILTRDFHAKEVRLFNLGPLVQKWFSDIRNLLRREHLSLDIHRSVAEICTQGFAVIAVFAIYGFVAFRTLQGLLSLGDFVMYIQAIQRGAGYLKDLAANLGRLYENNLFLTYLFEFLALETKVKSPVKPVPIPRPVQEGITFHDVYFHYPTGMDKILNGINLTIRPGEHIAFVGENGAGKTSLVKLLCRLYDPSAGSITLDGRDIREYDVTALRQEISVVFQDFAKYQLTISENVWLGDVSRSASPEAIQIAAKQAGAHSMVETLPQTYDTLLGKWFDQGKELSIGEWQKIALARAFYRDAQIVILDEPTSAIDAKAEFELFQRFHDLTKGRTAILISHRLSTVKMVDRIYVFKDGGIIESGTHDELVDGQGEYFKLFDLQAQQYR